jgi:drug/metabolite transporter (DMT)-like permease
MWVVADTAIKLAGESALPSYEIVAVEGLVLAALLILQRAVRGNIRLLWPAQPRRQLLRACLDLGNVLCVAVALRHLPLNLFYILVFTAPMVITIGAWLFLQEKLHLREAIAILAGFAGVAIAVNPFAPHGSGEGVGYAACAIAVLCFSASIVWLRRMTQTERLDSLMFSSASVSALGGSVAMLWHAAPLDPKLIALLTITGIAVGLGNLFSFQALRLISAATVSQYHYSQLVTGGTVAWLIWHEVPGWPLLAGAALIIASGLYVAAQGT